MKHCNLGGMYYGGTEEYNQEYSGRSYSADCSSGFHFYLSYSKALTKKEYYERTGKIYSGAAAQKISALL